MPSKGPDLEALSARSEQLLQISLVNWFERHYPKYAHRLFHVPNGGLRDKRTAKQMQLAGVRRGVPDLLFPVPKRGYTGLALELKCKDGKLSREQSLWLDDLRIYGWATAVPYTLEQAKDALASYCDD